MAKVVREPPQKIVLHSGMILVCGFAAVSVPHIIGDRPFFVNDNNTVRLALNGTCFVRQPAFYGRAATKYIYILVYFMAVSPYAACSSIFELSTACFHTIRVLNTYYGMFS